MRQIAVLIPLAPLALAAATPAAAQVEDRVTVVYGDEKCPTSHGQGITVCKRLPMQEKFRIPKDLREQEANPNQLGWATQQKVLNGTGQNAVQVAGCSAVGANVASNGCLHDEIRNWKAKQVADRKAEQGVP